MDRLRRLLGSAVLAAALVGCGGAPPDASPAQDFEVVLPPGGELTDALPVVVHDRTGLLQAVRPTTDDQAKESEIVASDPQTPDVLIARWIGSLCDERVELELTPFGEEFRLTGRTDRPLGACPMAGVFRAVELDFHEAVDPAIVHFDQGP